MAKGIFLSYRRDGGEAMAQLIYERLTAKGYAVFYDIESLNSGPFDLKLLEKIEACSDFVLILPPQALDRCIYEDDWVRREIAHALKCGKNIIPVMMRGFAFPTNLPEEIADVSRFNGVSFDGMLYLDAKFDKLISLLRSKAGSSTLEPDECGKPSLISNVCTIGTNDPNDFWPRGSYSPIISLDDFSIIRFHVKLLKKFKDERVVKQGYRIYDPSGACVLSEESEIQFMPEYDTYSVSWVIRGADGSYVQAGKYRAEFWIDNSRCHTIIFRVVSKLQEEYVTDDESLTKMDPKVRGAVNGRIAMIERQMATPKAWLLQTLAFSCFYYSMFADLHGIANTFFQLFSFILSITLTVLLVKHTKRHICKNILLAMIVVIPGFFLYAVYLLVSVVAWIFSVSKWKKELEILKHRI